MLALNAIVCGETLWDGSADASASLRRPRPSTNACGERDVAQAQSRPNGRHPAREPKLA